MKWRLTDIPLGRFVLGGDLRDHTVYKRIPGAEASAPTETEITDETAVISEITDVTEVPEETTVTMTDLTEQTEQTEQTAVQTTEESTAQATEQQEPPKKKLLFLYNPRSGKGLIKQHIFEILNIFSGGGYIVTAYPSQRRLDIHDRIVSDGGNYDLIVVSGGDGTLSETVQAMMETGMNNTTPLGYIPAGSTNDFAASMGIPRDMVKAARDIVEGVIYEYDVGCFNGRYFVYVAAFGMFTDISYETPQEVKNLIGHAAYILEGMRRLPTYKGVDLTVEHDGIVDKGNFIVGLVSNSRSVGGMAIPALGNTNFDDGLLEISMVRTPENAIMLQQMLSDVVVNRVNNKNFLVFSASEVKITSEEGVSWTIDGESGGTHTEIGISCCKRAVKFMIRPSDKTDLQTETDLMQKRLSMSGSVLFEDQHDIEN